MSNKRIAQETYIQYSRAPGMPDFTDQEAAFIGSQIAALMSEYGLVQLLVDLTDRRISTTDKEGRPLRKESQEPFTKELQRLFQIHKLQGINLNLKPAVCFWQDNELEQGRGPKETP